MRLLVNAISIREGGPLTVLEKLLDGMLSADRDLEITAIVHPHAAAGLAQPARLKTVLDGSADRSPARLLAFYNVSLPRLASAYDALFSMTNYLPVRRLTVPSVLLIQHAGHFSAEFDRLMRRNAGPAQFCAWRMKRAWTRHSVQRASRLVVQSKALADAIEKEAGIGSRPVDVIAHGPGLVCRAKTGRSRPAHDTLHVGYITKHGVQKNIGEVLDAMHALKSRGVRIRLHLTLNERADAFRPVADRISALSLMAGVENHGDIERSRIEALYDRLDVAVFASSVESFGFPMVEAMARALPVVALDTPVNREVLGAAGHFYPAGQPTLLASRVAEVCANDASYAQFSTASLMRAGAFDWPAAARQTLDVIKAAVAAGTIAGRRP